MTTHIIVWTVMFVTLLAASLALSISFIREKRYGTAFLTGSMTMCYLMLLLLHWNPLTILVKEVQPGIFLDQHGELVAMKLPEEIPTIYEVGDPERSGYVIRWGKWVQVIRLDDKYNPRVAERDVLFYRTELQAVVGNGRIVSLPKEVKTITKCVAPDSWWRKEHPGEVQGEIEFLVWPKSHPNEARIEKLIFQ